MANDCMNTLRAVSHTKEALERLISIMLYEDKEFYLDRIRDVETIQEPNQEEDGYWSAIIEFDSAWSSDYLLDGFSTGREEKADNGASFATFNDLCKKLHIGVECWAMEPAECFQQYFRVGSDGLVQFSDDIDWEPQYDEDEDDESETCFIFGTAEELYHPKEGGFENYGEWVENSVLMEPEKDNN